MGDIEKLKTICVSKGYTCRVELDSAWSLVLVISDPKRGVERLTRTRTFRHMSEFLEKIDKMLESGRFF